MSRLCQDPYRKGSKDILRLIRIERKAREKKLPRRQASRWKKGRIHPLVGKLASLIYSVSSVRVVEAIFGRSSRYRFTKGASSCWHLGSRHLPEGSFTDQLWPRRPISTAAIRPEGGALAMVDFSRIEGDWLLLPVN